MNIQLIKLQHEEESMLNENDKMRELIKKEVRTYINDSKRNKQKY